MAVLDRLKGLFNWPGRGTPRDRPRKGDPSEVDAYGQNPYQLYAQTVKPPYERRRKYDIYDEMDELPIISSILDAYAEDGSQVDREHKSAIWITAKDDKVKGILNDLKSRLQWNEYVDPITRDTGKYGDDFAALEVGDRGIEGWDFLDPRDIERVETRQGVLVGFENTAKLRDLQNKIDRKEKIDYTFKPWDIVHFRLYRR
ncbi:MAG: portal protein, partial [Gammaproteobacteria bacterium]|nr:portal protein [Gammaproteobacteria bacterium]